MVYVNLFILLILAAALLIPFAGAKWKGRIAFLTTLGISVVISIPAFQALFGNDFQIHLAGTQVTGNIRLVIDPLSAWFILLINFTFLTAAWYGREYMKAYRHKEANLSLHWISYVFAHAGILTVCCVHNALVFLIAWEMMAVSAFFLVIFEGHKTETIRGGINYLIQSHIAVVLLTLAFIWVSSKTGSIGFDSIRQFALDEKPISSFGLMLLFFAGFGLKAGFVPLHTWLPHAHPVAPSHISGMMSGVLIKIGIYGILRMIFLLNCNYLAIGYFILVVSVITGVYGVMLAIVQHNLKRLLAYHSIENIGIIGIGIGLGCIGMANANPALALLGFGGALLHTLNHSLFKSLLFFGAGNIHQSAHTMQIDRLGGLFKRMPHSAWLFLIASLAICGLPPFNGFVSEFIVYSGLLNGVQVSSFPYILLFITTLFGLTLIGGLAILCFTKAFGSVFLGSARAEFETQPTEANWQKLFPMYLIAVMIMAIGIFPQVFIGLLSLPLAQMTDQLPGNTLVNVQFGTLQQIGFYSLGFIVLGACIFWLRTRLRSSIKSIDLPTWGCGYVKPGNKMQYTASSFVRNYRKLAEPMLLFTKHKKDVKGVFPGEAVHLTHALDKVEEYLFVRPIRQLRYFLGRFSFLQNGRLQFYILYGMVFITLLIGVPFVIYLYRWFVKYL